MATTLVYSTTYGSTNPYLGGLRTVVTDNFYKVGSAWYMWCGLSCDLASPGPSVAKMVKASTVTGTWTVQDSTNEPLDTDFHLFNQNGHLECGVDGDGGFLIHAGYVEGVGTTDDVASVKFATSSDTWANTGGREYSITGIPIGGYYSGQSIQLTGTAAVDGDLVVSYADDTERVMGVEQKRAHLARYDISADTWTLAILADDSAANADAHYHPNRIIQSTVDEEVIHLFGHKDLLSGTNTNVHRNVYDLSTGLGTWNSSSSPYDGDDHNVIRQLVKTSNAREFIYLHCDVTGNYEIASYTENATTGYPGAPTYTGEITSVLSTSVSIRDEPTDFQNFPRGTGVFPPDIRLAHDGTKAWVFYLDQTDPPNLKYIEYTDDTSWAATNTDTHATLTTLGGTASDGFALLGAQYDSANTRFLLSWGEEEPSGTSTNEVRFYIYDYDLATGTQYNQSVAGSSTATGAITKQAQPVLEGSSTATGAVSRITSFVASLTGSLTAAGELLKETALSFAGSSTFTGLLNSTKVAFQSLAGSITATGAVSRITTFVASLTGSLTAAGELLKQAQVTLTGSSTWAGAVARATTFTTALAGAAAATGELLKQAQVTLTGSSTWTGTVAGIRTVLQALSGSITATGSILKQTATTLVGSIASSGTVATATAFLKAVAGSVTSVGAVLKQAQITLTGSSTWTGFVDGVWQGGTQFLQSVGGSITATGAALKQTATTLAGSVTSVGAVLKQAQITFTGSSTWTGAVAGIRTVLQALSGSITATGSILKQTATTLVGSIASSGTVATATAFLKAVAGSVTSVGAVLKQAQITLTGSSTWAGFVDGVFQGANEFFQSVGGSITATGSVLKQTATTLAGTATATGAVLKRAAVSFAGSISATGVMQEALTAVVSFVGSITATGGISKQVQKVLAGSVTAAGNIVRLIGKALTGSIAAIGTLIKNTRITVVGSSTFTGVATSVLLLLESIAGSSAWTGLLNAVKLIPPSVASASNAVRGWLRSTFYNRR